MWQLKIFLQNNYQTKQYTNVYTYFFNFYSFVQMLVESYRLEITQLLNVEQISEHILFTSLFKASKSFFL